MDSARSLARFIAPATALILLSGRLCSSPAAEADPTHPGISGLDLPPPTPSATAPSLPITAPPAPKTYSPKEKPEKLFAAFLAAYQAKDQWSASNAANALAGQEEGALPVLPKVLNFIRAVPTGTVADGQTVLYWMDAAKIVASIGSKAARPAAEMISEGDARSRSAPIGVIREGVDVSRFETITGIFDQLSIQGQSAVPKLLKLTESPNASIRAEACRCLAPIGPQAATTAARLLALCEDPDANCRREALGALARIEMSPERVTPALDRALSDSSKDVRNEALDIIGAIGEPAAALTDSLIALLGRADLNPPKFPTLLTEDHDLVRILRALHSAAGALDSGQCDQLANLLIHAGPHISSDVRYWMAAILSRAGSAAHPAIEHWLSATEEADDSAQVAVFQAAFMVDPPLREFSTSEQARLKKLMEKLPPPAKNWLISSAAPPTLTPIQMEIGGLESAIMGAEIRAKKRGMMDTAFYATPERIDRNIAALTGGDPDQTHQALWELAQAGPKATAAVPLLQSAVDRWKFSISPHDLTYVEDCYRAVASITGNSERWMQDAEKRVLIPMLARSDRDVWAMNSFTVAIHDMGGPRAFPYLVRWMNEDDLPFAREAMDSLIFWGAYDADWAARAIPLVLRRPQFKIEQHNEFARCVAAAGPAAAGAAPILIECLEKHSDENPMSQNERVKNILAALRAIGQPGARKALPILLKLYNEEPLDAGMQSIDGPTFRSELLETLRSLGGDLNREATVWVPKLAAALPDDYQGHHLIVELGAYGPLAAPAIPALIRHFGRQQDHESHQDVLEALAKIAPSDPRPKALQHLARFDRREFNVFPFPRN